jgi:hypothetical protein
VEVCTPGETSEQEQDWWTKPDLDHLLEIGVICATLLQTTGEPPVESSTPPSAASAEPPSAERSALGGLIEWIMTEPDDSTVCPLRFSQFFTKLLFVSADNRRLLDA